ncbi:N-acetyltransferase [bacterium]|nr:N-acetyltransferase [bacterium]
MIKIIPVLTRKQRNQFIRFPWKVYRSDAQWVPPLLRDSKEMLNTKKFPFFEHSEAAFFLAQKGTEIVGTICAILNNRHNQIHNQNLGFFGFFEFIDDVEVSRALLETALKWCGERGLDAMRGPANYSQNETCGLLIDGFDTSPMVLMTHNPPYYQTHYEQFGLTKSMDLLAYRLTTAEKFPARLIRTAEKLKERSTITIRGMNNKDFKNEIQRVKEIYNQAWLPNWGFVPLTEAELNHLAKELHTGYDPELALIAEKDGKPVGFSLAMPNLNPAIKAANGRLFPFGLFKILREAKKVNSLRVVIMGVIPEYQKQGIDSMFYLESYKRALAKGYEWGECSWILENNKMMNRALQMLGAKVYKTYRMYDMSL